MFSNIDSPHVNNLTYNFCCARRFKFISIGYVCVFFFQKIDPQNLFDVTSLALNYVHESEELWSFCALHCQIVLIFLDRSVIWFGRFFNTTKYPNSHDTAPLRGFLYRAGVGDSARSARAKPRRESLRHMQHCRYSTLDIENMDSLFHYEKLSGYKVCFPTYICSLNYTWFTKNSTVGYIISHVACSNHSHYLILRVFYEFLYDFSSYSCTSQHSEWLWMYFVDLRAVLRIRIRIRIRIHRIHVFLGLQDPDKNSKKNLDSYYFVTLFEFLSLKNDVNLASKRHKQKKLCWEISFLLASWRSMTKIEGSGSRIRIRIRIRIH
jgi:hypothetical protein